MKVKLMKEQGISFLTLFKTYEVLEQIPNNTYLIKNDKGTSYPYVRDVFEVVDEPVVTLPTFGNLSREKQLELINAALDGHILEVMHTYEGSRWMLIFDDDDEDSLLSFDRNSIYRIKPVPLTKPSINWDHVHPDFKWMARDSDGSACVYEVMPYIDETEWIVYTKGWKRLPTWVKCEAFVSYEAGTCEPKDSLVERPQ